MANPTAFQKRKIAAIQSFLLVSALALTACGTRTEVPKTESDVDSSAAVVSEAELNDSGCAFVEEETMKLKCADASSPLDQYRQTSAVAKYLLAARKSASSSRLSPDTKLGLLSKLVAANRVSIYLAVHSIRETVEQPAKIETYEQIEEFYFRSLRELAALHSVFLENASLSAASGSDEGPVVRVYDTGRIPQARDVVTDMETELSRFLEHPDLTSNERAGLESMVTAVKSLNLAFEQK